MIFVYDSEESEKHTEVVIEGSGVDLENTTAKWLVQQGFGVSWYGRLPRMRSAIKDTHDNPRLFNLCQACCLHASGGGFGIVCLKEEFSILLGKTAPPNPLHLVWGSEKGLNWTGHLRLMQHMDELRRFSSLSYSPWLTRSSSPYSTKGTFSTYMWVNSSVERITQVNSILPDFYKERRRVMATAKLLALGAPLSSIPWRLDEGEEISWLTRVQAMEKKTATAITKKKMKGKG